METEERKKAIDDLVKACIKEGRLSWALESAELGASQKAIDDLVEAYIKEGQISHAQKVAKLGGRDLTLEEINKIREVVIAKS